MNLNKYSYNHQKAFVKDSLDHWKMMNFKGEVYEASFYEKEATEIDNNRSGGISLAAKGPYSPDSTGPIKRGFFNDKSGSLIFNSNSISLSEFDCLKISEIEINFYECTLTQKPENLRSLKAESLRKSELLKRLFPDKEIICTIVSDNEVTLDYFSRACKFKTLLHEFPGVALTEIAKNSKADKLPSSSAMISASQLNKIITNFDYLDDLEKICSSIFSQNSILPIEHNIISGNGLFQRVYWGKIATQEIDSSINTAGAKEVLISVNLSNIKAPKLRYYFTTDNGRSFYEALSTPKKLSHWKSSREELVRIYKKLPYRTKDDLRKLEGELHNKWLKSLASHTGKG